MTASTWVNIGQLDTGYSPRVRPLREAMASFVRVDRNGALIGDAPPSDKDGHGSHIAGILTQILPEARLFSAQVINGGMIISRILSGMNWLLDQPVRVACMSIGVKQHTPIFYPMIQALRKKGILSVVSIGNGGAGTAHSPGWYPNVLSVGSLCQEGTVSGFSGSYNLHGAASCLKPELLAPGEEILSFGLTGKPEKKSGTSMASAQVAAQAARIFHTFPAASIEQVEWALCSSALHPQGDFAHKYVFGVVDEQAAMDRLHMEGSTVALKDGYRNSPSAVSKSSTNMNARFFDPRLRRQISHAGTEAKVNAVMVLYPKVEPETLMANPAISEIHAFRAANTFIIQTGGESLLQIASNPSVWMLSAVDIDFQNG